MPGAATHRGAAPARGRHREDRRVRPVCLGIETGLLAAESQATLERLREFGPDRLGEFDFACAPRVALSRRRRQRRKRRRRELLSDRSPSVVVVVPTYNERPNLEVAGRSGCSAPGPGYRILIVDDNSPDGTGDLADDAGRGASWPGRGDASGPQGGLGPAYVAGFRRALARGPTSSPRWTPTTLTIRRHCRFWSRRRSDADLTHRLPLHPGAEGTSAGRSGAGSEPDGRTLRAPRSRRAGGGLDRRVQGLAPANLDRRRHREPAFRWLRIHDRSDLAGVAGRARVCEVPIVFTDRVAGASKFSRRIVVEAALLVWRLRWEGRPRPRSGEPS